MFGSDSLNGDTGYVDQVSLNLVPEPSSSLLMGLAGLGLAFRRKRVS